MESSNEIQSPTAIEMWRVDFELARKLLQVLETSAGGAGGRLDTGPLKQRVADILRIPNGDQAFREMEDVRHIVSYCCLDCLATQLLSFEFLSYIQAHVGAIRPFLQTPLETIHLLGAETSMRDGARIKVSQKHFHLHGRYAPSASDSVPTCHGFSR